MSAGEDGHHDDQHQLQSAGNEDPMVRRGAAEDQPATAERHRVTELGPHVEGRGRDGDTHNDHQELPEYSRVDSSRSRSMGTRPGGGCWTSSSEVSSRVGWARVRRRTAPALPRRSNAATREVPAAPYRRRIGGGSSGGDGQATDGDEAGADPDEGVRRRLGLPGDDLVLQGKVGGGSEQRAGVPLKAPVLQG